MAFDLDQYKSVSGKLDLAGIDFGAFAEEPLAPDHLRCLRYMHDIEMHTACYLRNLLNTRAHADPEVTEFLTIWNFEELWHGDAIARVLAAHGEPAGAPRVATMRERMGWRLASSPVLWMAFSAATRSFLAVHMTFGVVNEWTTQAGYARLAQLAGHPVLSEVLSRIMRQEGRHIDFYRSLAVRELDGDRAAQRTTRRLLSRLWAPVGAKAMPREEAAHLVRTLFTGGPEGTQMVERIDRRIDRLPGLAGMDLMSRGLAAYAA